MWSGSAKLGCWGELFYAWVYLVPPLKAIDAIYNVLRVMHVVFQKGELPYCSGNVDVSLHDVLAFNVSSQHFRLH